MTAITVLEHWRCELKKELDAVWIRSTGPARAIFPSVTLFVANETIEPYTIHQKATLLTVYVVVWIKGQRNDEKTEYELSRLAGLVRSLLTCPPDALDMEWISTDPEIDESEPEIHSNVLTYHLLIPRN